MKRNILNMWKKACCVSLLAAAAACTPDNEIPPVKFMDITIDQSAVNDGIKAAWQVGEEVSVFFDGVRSPKYFTIKSVSADGNSAVVNGDFPFGLEEGCGMTAVYPATEIDADAAAVKVDLSEQKYVDGRLDMSSMVYSARGAYQKEAVAPMSLAAQTTKLTINIEPFAGFDPAKLSRVELRSGKLTTKASLNAKAGEGEEPWGFRENKGLVVNLKEPVEPAARANGGVSLDVICVPSQAESPVNDIELYFTSGEDMFYAVLDKDVVVDKNTVNVTSPVRLLDKEESASLIFWNKLCRKQLNTGVIRDKDGVFSAYYEIDYEAKNIKFLSLGKADYKAYKPVAESVQKLNMGFYTFDWETPVEGVKGLKYDPSTDEVSLKLQEGAVASFDNNATAADDFKQGRQCHYEVKFLRGTDAPFFERGAMSKNLWQAAMNQGVMTAIELNRDRGWEFVTYPNNYTSYVTRYEKLAKDRMKISWTGEFFSDFKVDQELNERTIRQTILNTFFAENNIFVPAMQETRVFFVINPVNHEWFKFQPQTEDDLSVVDGTAIEKRLIASKFDTGVFRQGPEEEFKGYYRLDIPNLKATFYIMNKDNSDMQYMENVAIVNENRRITWKANILEGIKGIELDNSNNLKLIGASVSRLDNNSTAAAEFLDKGAGHHYSIDIDRSAGKCSKGNMSPLFIQEALNQGFMKTIEVNKDRNWEFTTFPHNWTSYINTQTVKGKDVILFSNPNLECNANAMFRPDADLNSRTLPNMLRSFHDENIVVRAKTGGRRPFYVINKKGIGWFLFERNQ